MSLTSKAKRNEMKAKRMPHQRRKAEEEILQLCVDNLEDGVQIIS
jgi:hypothetical protein